MAIARLWLLRSPQFVPCKLHRRAEGFGAKQRERRSLNGWGKWMVHEAADAGIYPDRPLPEVTQRSASADDRGRTGRQHPVRATGFTLSITRIPPGRVSNGRRNQSPQALVSLPSLTSPDSPSAPGFSPVKIALAITNNWVSLFSLTFQ